MISFFVRSFWLILLVLLPNGCAPVAQVVNLQQTDGSPPPFTSHPTENNDLERLAQLWQRRNQNTLIADYPIGPGDVLEISVPAMQELTNSTVRVSSEGTISLPFIGVVQASGLTEKGLREEIRRRLEKNYMYNPQVNLYVREYRSRQVAIVGAVAKPGLFSLTRRDETLLDTISLAGGMTKDAAPRIHFIPAEPLQDEKARENASTLSAPLVSKGSSPTIPKAVDPIVIDLQNLIRGGNQIYLALHVRPGDVIIVPGSGEVLVDGWVEKPGSYKITPGLTVLGAVAAAGGSLFAADTSSVKIIRTGKQGEKIFLLADLEGIKNGDKPDIPVEEGDVIKVPSSTPKLLAYGLYQFFSSIFRIGANVVLF